MSERPTEVQHTRTDTEKAAVSASLDEIGAMAMRAFDERDALRAQVRALREALDNLVNAPALSGIADLVRGWSGKPDDPNPRHPSNLGAQIKTTCGRVYQLDEALTAARAALGTGGGNG